LPPGLQVSAFSPQAKKGQRIKKNSMNPLIRRSLMILLFQCVLASAWSVAQTNAPRLFLVDPGTMVKIRSECLARDPSREPALKQLIKDADKLLTKTPVSVMEKSQVPPSGDKHDYMSLARYFWPDPKKPDGLPYINRDGEVNPEVYEMSDYRNNDMMVDAVSTLALAYYLTGNDRYAEHAVRFIRTWFIDSTTRMNPNFNFAQAVKGKSGGRSSGIIESRGFTRVIDGIGLLADFKGWTLDDQKRMVEWFDRFLTWLQTSDNGRAEAKSTNNHGVWYDVQVASMALFVGKRDAAKEVLERAKPKRIGEQIEPDGSQPRELARTTSKHYTAFNLEAFFALAAIGSNAGVDLWNYQSDDGRSIREALDWVIPYLRNEKEWTHKQINSFDPARYYPVLIKASLVFRNQSYEELATKLAGAKGRSHRIHLLDGN
jgi:hypothetical protein